MTAKDAILNPSQADLEPTRHVDSETPLMEVLPLLLDAPGHELAVYSREGYEGTVTESSLLEAFGNMIAPRDDSSVVTVECPAADYSASSISHAVEDGDAHLVDLLSRPGEDGSVRVTLRVRTLDPGNVCQNLERYGYHVVEAGGHASPDDEVLAERLAGLQALLDV